MQSVALCTVLLALRPTEGHRWGGGAPYQRRGLFGRAGWGSRASTTSNARRPHSALILFPRGGADSAVAEETASSLSEQSLDERVNAAMRRLGLSDEPEPSAASDAPPPPPPPLPAEANCEGGVCTIDTPDEPAADSTEGTAAAAEEAEEAPAEPAFVTQEDIYEAADRIASDLSVPKDISLAAIYSSFTGPEGNKQIDEEAARSIVQAEVDAIAGVPEECDEVKQLVEEGFDSFFARRSLAFAGMDVDNARAILIADREDEETERKEMEAAEAEARAAAQKEEEQEMKTVTVEYPKNFDPLASAAAAAAPKPQAKPEGAPPPAKKEDVVFEGTTEDLQKLVVESPVPVLLDVYADWCGPCRQLTPALEQICVNAGGMLRLVKINTDQQRQISSALGVKALPTVFGIRDGKILNSFQGMARDQAAVQNFLMGLMVPGQQFNPPVTVEEKKEYDELSGKLIKLAAGASFSFSARERLQSRVGKLLDELVEEIGGETGMAVADDSARVLRSLMSNVIRNPFDEKFRKVKLDNKVIAAKVAQYQPCIAILRSIGFSTEGDAALVVAKGKRVVNIAPFTVARDCIDKWIDRNRYHIAAAGRKRKDEMERVRLAKEAEEAAKNQVDEEEEEESEEEVDTSLCVLKLRLEGKKKVHYVEMDADDTLNALLDKLPFEVEEGETVQFTCVARRLIVKSTDDAQMSKTLSELKLAPAASVVVKIGEGKADVSKGSLAERAASNKKKTGSHSMHSIGLYAKDDGNKAESFESGGVLYDHDISDDEEEGGEEGDIAAEGEDEEVENDGGEEDASEDAEEKDEQ